MTQPLAAAPAALSRLTTRETLLDCGVIAVVRLPRAADLHRVAEALAAGGVRGIELTLTTPGALEAIRELGGPGGLGARCVIGAGTVLGPDAARQVMDAGARFVVSPVFAPDVVAACRERDVVVMPGAFTPTEILRAWDAGADVVKVFPSSILGPRYFRDVLAPLPHVRLTPTGGVTLENVGDWIEAGAAAVGVGGALVDPVLVAAGDWEALTARARDYVERVAAARSALTRADTARGTGVAGEEA